MDATVDEVVVGVPDPRLRPYVDRYLGYRERAEQLLVRREVAGAFVVVILGWGAPLDVVDPRCAERSAYRVDSFVAGPFDAYCTTSTVGVGVGVELLLTPLAARRILGVPLGELANRAVAVEQLPGGWLDRLRHRLADTPGWPERFALLDAAITARLATADPVDPRLSRAWRRLAGSGGEVPVGAVAEELGWSRRHLAARFRREAGLTPKTTRPAAALRPGVRDPRRRDARGAGRAAVGAVRRTGRLGRCRRPAATKMRASAPPFRAGVKARAGGPARPERALAWPVLLLDVLTQDGQGCAVEGPGEV